MSERHDDELQALFDNADVDFPSDGFADRVMSRVRTAKVSSTISTLLYAFALLVVALTLFLHLREHPIGSMLAGSFAGVVSSPWLLAVLMPGVTVSLLFDVPESARGPALLPSARRGARDRDGP